METNKTNRKVNTGNRIVKKKKALLKIILIPILVIVLIQGTVPFMTLVFSGIKENLENNTIQMDAHMVEKSQVILQNDMIEKWRAVYKESDGLDEQLSEILKTNGISVQEFLGSEELQKTYLSQVFPGLVETLQYSTTSGIYLIMANEQPTDQAAEYQGFFVRDSDPQTRISSNTDLLLERGNKQLAHSLSISLDNAWSTDFEFQGNGVRAADDFFYKPYLAALEHKDSNMVDLGYWAKPFILEDHYMDNHEMITYSVPLQYDGEIYGILGVEISLKYLDSYFNVKDLDNSLNAGYALAAGQGDNQYKVILGKGALYDVAARTGETLKLKESSKSQLYQVEGATVGKQSIYAIVKPLSLYSNNVPYEDTDWCLCGLVTENSIYGLGNSVYKIILAAILGSTMLAAICVYFLVFYVTKPVKRLVEGVRGGVEGIHAFAPAEIVEIDELHDVIENLTDAQQQAEEQLLEEKERYRIAVETSDDVFFTFYKKKQMLEIVNSTGHDGIWNCMEHPEFVETDFICPEDRNKLRMIFENPKEKVSLEFRLRHTKEDPYYWAQLTGRVFQDETGDYDRLVGCIHNIQQRKMLEEAQRTQQQLDSTTTFYRWSYGIKAIEESRKKYSQGALAVTNIEKFSAINEKYGLVYGDLILERVAHFLKEECKKATDCESIGVRAGADQMLIWVPGITVKQMSDLMKCVREKIAHIVDENYLILNFQCGITVCEKNQELSETVSQAFTALAATQSESGDVICYEKLSEFEKKLRIKKTEQTEPFEKLKQMSLPSLALNLFDRSGEMKVSMDMLALKIQEIYHMENLIITKFYRDTLVNLYGYSWKEKDNSWDGILRCNGSEYKQYVETKVFQKLMPVTENERNDVTICRFLQQKDSWIFHMTDEGSYSGSIIFVGTDNEILQDEHNQKRLEEVCTIIQNRMNLEKHDLSAQAKSEFLARMSHEIRTPMNGIIGMTEIALQKEQTEEKRRDCLKKIQSSSNYLLNILNDILDMSKIESGKMRLVYGNCNLKKMLDNIEILMESRMSERQICFTKQINLIHEWFYCDELRINQVLLNLLSNAVKYTHEGGNVCLTVREISDESGKSSLYFSVQDDGVGIEKEKQKLIFQNFEQADESEIARRQGTGLGLAISRRLLHMMDSDINLESELRKGSKFSFTLQLKYLENVEESEERLEKSVNLKGKHILIVEDNELNMEIIHTILNEYGAEIEEAYDGQQALEKMCQSKEGEYDLILMDIMMPVMGGLEAAREIRNLARKDCKNIPIIAMSANAFDEDVKKSLANGMNAHLSKPINMEQLEKTLMKFIKGPC